MSWQYGMGFMNPTQFMTRMQSLSQPFFSNQIPLNQLFNPYALNFFNITQNFPIFQTNCLDAQPHCPTQQINHIVRSEDPNNLENLEEQNEKSESQQNQEMSNNQSSFELQDIRMVRFRRRRRAKKPKNTISHNSSLRNDTKNIPKNYGKAILAYIQKNSRQTKELLSIHDVDHLEFMMAVKNFKSKINTIHDLRQMWGQEDKGDPLKKCIRILSYHFMRKKCLPYIFNSRVKNFHTHLKYKRKITQGIENPQHFTKIKQF